MNYIKYLFPKIIIIATVLSFIILFSCNQQSTRKKIALNDAWEFYNAKTDKWYDAKVPGNIHTDLFNNQLIDNPFFCTNADSLTWISNETWKYRKKFDIPTEFFNRNLELVFDGIDTHADIYLNDKMLGTTSNMYRQWVFVIDDTIRKKEDNILEVIFHPSSKYNYKKLELGAYAIPDDRNFTRKAPYQYGWDWAPKLETCGLYKDVYITSWEKLRICNANIEQKILTDTVAILIAHIELESENYYNGEVKIISPDNEFDTLQQKLEIFEGKQIYPVEFKIRKPQLWWSNGLGPQKMYNIKLQVSTKFRLEEISLKIGLRNIELCTDTDSHGQEFYFKINGQPVFAKGANWVPAEYFSGSNSRKKYEELLILAKEANFNMLRVWGGGIYENEEFYAICDSLGIMVWQDFMFSCAMYPLDEEFTENVKEEVKYQVNRLYNHPSIVLWCGNNEISNGWFDWGWQKEFNLSEEDSIKIWNDYDNLFHRIIPAEIAKIDKSRKYIPSSPFFGWGHPESLTHGDSHYWGVWWGMEDFSMYYEKTGRFMSEYGFQSLPTVNSLKRFIPTDSLYKYSASLNSHQKHPFGFKAIKEYMQRSYLITKDFEDYVYLSQILQAEGMQTAFDAHLSAIPYCMGTLFWQFNDCWPSISWSAIDYYNSPKALYYYSKRAFQNIFIVSYINNNTFKTFVINHDNNNIKAKVRLNLFNFYGDSIASDSSIIILNNISSTPVEFESHAFDSIKKYINDAYVHLKVYDYNTEEFLVERVFVFGINKNLNLPKAEFHYNTTKNKNYWEISLKSRVFIKNLFLYSGSGSGTFSDNFFDLLPNETKMIKYYPEFASDGLKLKFKSVNQIIFDKFLEELTDMEGGEYNDTTKVN
jgi:beta-mannosidase